MQSKCYVCDRPVEVTDRSYKPPVCTDCFRIHMPAPRPTPRIMRPTPPAPRETPTSPRVPWFYDVPTGVDRAHGTAVLYADGRHVSVPARDMPWRAFIPRSPWFTIGMETDE